MCNGINLKFLNILLIDTPALSENLPNNKNNDKYITNAASPGGSGSVAESRPVRLRRP